MNEMNEAQIELILKFRDLLKQANLNLDVRDITLWDENAVVRFGWMGTYILSNHYDCDEENKDKELSFGTAEHTTSCHPGFCTKQKEIVKEDIEAPYAIEILSDAVEITHLELEE